MADKEPMIVIKKINVQAAGAHGGSWKVAFADFMTALMAFFLCMWLLNQSEEVKTQVSDYFSTPSVIEYNFSNYGVELTLEKLFLDLINEPLKVLRDFITPADSTPNFLSMGSKNIVVQHLADQLGEVATQVEVNSDEIVIEFPIELLFAEGQTKTTSRFVPTLERVKEITQGLQDADIFVDMVINRRQEALPSLETATQMSQMRLDLITSHLEEAKIYPSVDLYGKTIVLDTEVVDPSNSGKMIIRMKQKSETSDGRKPRKLNQIFGSGESKDVYADFVKKLSRSKNQPQSKKPVE